MHPFCNSIRKRMSVVRFRPFDTSTPEGRSLERLRRLSLATLASILGKFVALLPPLVAIPLTLDYLGAERFGLWMTITSIIAILEFTDLGLGDGLITVISRSDGKGDRNLAARYVSSGLFLLGIVGLAIFVVFMAAGPWIAWDRIFNVHSPDAIHEAGPGVIAMIACFAINLPLTTVQRVQSGYQEVFQSQLWRAAGNLFALIGLVIAVRARCALPTLVWVGSGIPVMFAAFNALLFFGWQRAWLWPRWENVSKSETGELLRRGFLFFLISLFSTIGVGADNILAARILGAQEVSRLYVPTKLFATISSLATMIYLPMWGANAESLARGDTLWIRRSLTQLTTFGALALSALALFIILVGDRLIAWWVGSSLIVPTSLLWGLAFWFIVSSVVGPALMVLNAADILRPQVIIYALFAVLVLPAKVFLVHTLGISGIPWANAVVFAATIALPLHFLVRRLLATWR